MSRTEMIFALESYWEAKQRQYPDEPMDIPGAVEYYNQISLQELQAEYDSLVTPRT